MRVIRRLRSASTTAPSDTPCDSKPKRNTHHKDDHNSTTNTNTSAESNSNTILRRLSRLRSNSHNGVLSLNMFRPRRSSDASPPSAPPAPSRNLSMFGSLRRPSRAQSDADAFITLSTPTTPPPRDEIVTDDELSGCVRPAQFSLVRLVDPDDSGSDDTGSDTTFSQAGGHDGSFQLDGSQLVKKVTPREAEFYERAAAGEWPTNLLPKFHGRAGEDAISIENLTHGYSRPCVVDMKMGIHSFESDEPNLIKRLKMSALDQITRSRYEGCRLEGLSMFRTIDKQSVALKGSKRQTHALSMNLRISLQDTLTFFLTDEYGVRTDVALRFQNAIEDILRQFERNDKFLFIGSSILLIYNNDNNEPHMRWARALRKLHTIAPHVRLSEDQISGLTRRTLCDVRMIDFAHTGPLPQGVERDEGYLKGLHSILRALKAIRAYRSKPIFSFESAAIDIMEEHRAKNLAAQANGEPPPAEGNYTFDTVLNQLTAVSQMDEEERQRQKQLDSS